MDLELDVDGFQISYITRLCLLREKQSQIEKWYIGVV